MKARSVSKWIRNGNWEYSFLFLLLTLMLLTQANSMSRLKMHHHYAAVDLIRMSDPSGEDVESTKKLRDN